MEKPKTESVLIQAQMERNQCKTAAELLYAYEDLITELDSLCVAIKTLRWGALLNPKHAENLFVLLHERIESSLKNANLTHEMGDYLSHIAEKGQTA